MVILRSKKKFAVGATKRTKRATNVSRKEIVKAKKASAYEEKLQRRWARKDKKKQARVGVQHMQNRRTNRAFDHDILRLVNESLIETIEAMPNADGSPMSVDPLSIFGCACTTLDAGPTPQHVPYLLAIISAVLPKLSTGVLMSRLSKLISYVENALGGSDNLTSSKAIKLLQTALVSINPPNQRMLDTLKRLEPNKMNYQLMSAYVATWRKVLTHAFIAGHVDFFLEAFPQFVELCVTNFTETRNDVAKATKKELKALLEKVISPAAINIGAQVLDQAIGELTTVYKAAFKDHWALVADVVAVLFRRLNFLKRSPEGQYPPFEELFPKGVFLLRVLDKIRQVEDVQLNPHVTKAIVSIASCMPVASLMNILPFNPSADDVSNFVAGRGEDPWRRSYLVNVIRQVAHHDSLPFLVSEFLPRIAQCQQLQQQLTAEGRHPEVQQWLALEQQYWRVTVGFCHYPVEVTNDSFRSLAKAWVGLLNTPLVDVAASAFHVVSSGLQRLAALEQDADEVFEDEEDEEDEGQWKPADEDEEVMAMVEDDGWNPHQYHNISQQHAQESCQILAKYSSNIMPKLCNTMEQHDTTAVLSAIQSFSKVCSPNTMATILQGILDLGSNITQFPEDNHSQLSSKRRVVLDIATAIVGQMSLENLHQVFDSIVEPVLADTSLQNRLLQKKAYKLLLAIFEVRLRDILPMMDRVVRLLTLGQAHVTVSGLKMRVKCLSCALDAYKMFEPDSIASFVKQTLPEVVMFSRERSGGARMYAMDMLARMQHFAVQAGSPPSALIFHCAAGLAGKTPMLVSSTIVALAKLVFVAHESLQGNDLTRLFAMIAKLVAHTNTEVRTASADFIRMALRLGRRSNNVANAATNSLPTIAEGIALVTSQESVSSATRTDMRVLLERCIRTFGESAVQRVFPEGSQRYFQYVAKGLRRQTRREARERAEGDGDEFGEVFLGGLRAGDENEADGDLLGSDGFEQFAASKSALRPTKDDDDEEDPREALTLVTDKEGKMRITTKAARKAELESEKRRELANRLLRGGNGPSIAKDSLLRDQRETTQAKRKRDDVQDYENEELIDKHGGQADIDFTKRYTKEGKEASVAAQLQRKRDERAEKREEKRKRMEHDIKTGEEFATDKGFGDVKKGNVDPFAYVPLNRKFLNKRNQRFGEERMKSVVNKSLKGDKARRAADAMKQNRKA